MAGQKKLSADAKAYVLQALAEFKLPSEIQYDLQVHFDTRVSVQNIYKNYKEAYKDEIKVIRKAFLEGLAEVPIYHQRVRLEYRQKMINKIMSANDPVHFSTASRLLDGCVKELEVHLKNEGSLTIDERLAEISHLLQGYDEDE